MSDLERVQVKSTQAPSDIHLQNVKLHLEGKLVLNQLTFNAKVKRLGIIGRNGSGKSTLSRALAGLVKISAGSLLVAGIDPYKNRSAALQEIGILFQNPDHQIIFPTVLEEIIFGLRQLGQTKNSAQKNALQTLADFGKTHWKDAHNSALSQGQKHLVCLMAIVAMQPKLIILDEPFAGLDIPTKLQLKRYLSQFTGNLIHISHDPDDLDNCDQLLWLEEGQVAEIGDAASVLPNYLKHMHTLGGSDDISHLSH